MSRIQNDQGSQHMQCAGHHLAITFHWVTYDSCHWEMAVLIVPPSCEKPDSVHHCLTTFAACREFRMIRAPSTCNVPAIIWPSRSIGSPMTAATGKWQF